MNTHKSNKYIYKSEKKTENRYNKVPSMKYKIKSKMEKNILKIILQFCYIYTVFLFAKI